MIVASTDKELFDNYDNYDPSKSTSWKVLETVLSDRKCRCHAGKSRQDQEIEVGRLPSSFHSIKAVKKDNNHDICRGRRSFFFEISPYRDFSLPSRLKRPRYRATLGP